MVWMVQHSSGNDICTKKGKRGLRVVHHKGIHPRFDIRHIQTVTSDQGFCIIGISGTFQKKVPYIFSEVHVDGLVWLLNFHRLTLNKMKIRFHMFPAKMPFWALLSAILITKKAMKIKFLFY